MQKLRQQIINIGFDRPHDISMYSSPNAKTSSLNLEEIRNEMRELRGLIEFIKEDVS